MITSIKKNHDFLNVYHHGKACMNRTLVIYCLKTQNKENRYGITVSKKIGNSVVRHRITRLIRECIRYNNKKFPIGYDIVIVARRGACKISCQKMEQEFLHLMKKHHFFDGSR